MKPTVDYSSDSSESSEEEELLLRRGQWTKEEVIFASRLIDEFLNGALPNSIPDGTNMRGFLACKLSCAPKRISKKYECHSPVTSTITPSTTASAQAPVASTAGKAVTPANTISTADAKYNGRIQYKHNHSLSAETCVRTRLQLEALEKKFHQSLERAEDNKKKKKVKALANKKVAAAKEEKATVGRKRPAQQKLKPAQTKKARKRGDLSGSCGHSNVAGAAPATAVHPVAAIHSNVNLSQSANTNANTNYLLSLLASRGALTAGNYGLSQPFRQPMAAVATGMNNNLNELMSQRIIAAAQESARQQQQQQQQTVLQQPNQCIIMNELLRRQVAAASCSARAAAIQRGQTLLSNQGINDATLNDYILKKMLRGDGESAAGFSQQQQMTHNNIFQSSTHELLAAKAIALGGHPASSQASSEALQQPTEQTPGPAAVGDVLPKINNNRACAMETVAAQASTAAQKTHSAVAPAWTIASRMNIHSSATRTPKPTLLSVGAPISNDLLTSKRENNASLAFADSLVASVTARSSGPLRNSAASQKK